MFASGVPGFVGVFDLAKLECLSVVSLRARLSTRLRNLTALRKLQLLDSRLSDLQALGFTPQLTSIGLGGLNQVTLDPLSNILGLRTIDINACKRLEDIDPISKLASVVTLWLNNCGLIPSLKPLLSNQGLAQCSFYESTDVLDGDVACLLHFEQLEPPVSFKDRPHYNMNRTNLNSILAKRRGKSKP